MEASLRLMTADDSADFVKFRKLFFSDFQPELEVTPELERRLSEYFLSALPEGSLDCVCCEERGQTVAMAGSVYYRVMPTILNPGGKMACLMSVYTLPEYRRRGLALAMVKRLLELGKARGVGKFTLNATDAGRPVYEKAGFSSKMDEMILMASPDA